MYKLAVKEWSRIKEGGEVEKLILKHNEERKKEETTEAGKCKKLSCIFKCNKQSSIHKKKDKTGDKSALSSPPPSIMLSNASGKSKDISVTENFLETLQVSLGEIIESVKHEKVVINSLEAVSKTYHSFHQKLIFFKENSTRRKVTNFPTDLNQLDKILATLSQLIISCNDVKMDQALGLLHLQKSVLDNNLNRRVVQLKKCDTRFENLSKIAFFCRNKSELP